MGSGEVFKYEFLSADKVLVGTMLVEKVDKAEADAAFQAAESGLASQPEHIGFFLDALKVKSVSTPAIGILMKTLGLMKKTKNLMILVITEPLLQEIMLQQPARFDFFAVFHNRQDAVTFIKK